MIMPVQIDRGNFSDGSTSIGTMSNGFVIFDGEQTTSKKRYKSLNGANFVDGTRVLLIKVRGDYVILGSIN